MSKFADFPENSAIINGKGYHYLLNMAVIVPKFIV